MANRLGVTTPAVNKWENSNSKPDIELLAPIAVMLDARRITDKCTNPEKYLDYFSEHDPMKSYYQGRLLQEQGNKHMKFRDIDGAILDGVKEKLLEGFRNEEEFGYMTGYEPAGCVHISGGFIHGE